jgi:hypothetical protein
VTQLIPDGFLSILQAAQTLATAMYSGVADQPRVAELKASGFDVFDGAARDDAIYELWKGYDDEKVETFLIGATQQIPLKLPNDMSNGIPGLRSPRGRDFTLLRPRNRHRHQLVEWFGRDLSTVAVVFREIDVKRLARTLLRARRRKAASAGRKKIGRPSRQSEVQSVVHDVVELGKWHPTGSIKTLTAVVNRQGKFAKPVSEDTVGRALQRLHEKTHDRRYERVSRKRR